MRAQLNYGMPRKHPPPILGLVAIAIALPPPTVTEMVIDSDVFVTRLAPDLTVTLVEQRSVKVKCSVAAAYTYKHMYMYVCVDFTG